MNFKLYYICVVFFLITFKHIVAHNDFLNHKPYRERVANYHQPTERHTEQVRSQPVGSPGCPQHCSCKMNDTHYIVSVDCSSKGLEMIPDLPETTVELSLRNNSISNISCKSFELLLNLENLNLAFNWLLRLRQCVFMSQSTSLLNLKMSDDQIEVLDVQLFQNLSYLKTLDLSRNFIMFLDSRTFSDLAQLVNLNLSCNHIGHIAPNAFKGLHSLKTLSLLNNLLDDETSFYEDIFQGLGALETLNVKANRGGIDDAVSALKNLSHLYMEVNPNYRKYKVLGPGFRQLTNLQVLNLSTIFFQKGDRYKISSLCNLEKAPRKFFGNIRTKKNLELYLYYCSLKLRRKPNFLFPSTLVSLDLSDNDALRFNSANESWMKSLVNTRISYLDLSRTWYNLNRHYIYDWWFTHIAKTNLKTLILIDNRIASISETPNFPNTIEKLDVSNNCIALGQLYLTFINSNHRDFKLKELYANGQKDLLKTAKQISQHTSDVSITGALNASGTNYKRPDKTRGRPASFEVPESVFLNISQTVNVSISMSKTVDSRYATVSDDIFSKENVTCLRNMKLLDSDIKILCLPPHLEAIYANSSIASYVIDSIPHIRIFNNTVLRHVVLADNPLKTLLGPVENVPSLRYLDLSRNKCGNLSVHFFKYMISLQTLILEDNSIGPSLAADPNGLTFSTLTNLTLLDVSHNRITDLSRSAFINNRNLEKLDLSNNQLSEFQPTISTILNMSFLDLTDNFLRGLSEQTSEELQLLKSRNNNFTVNILGNRLLFTCDYLPFLQLVSLNPSIFFNVEHLQFKHTNATKFSYDEMAHSFPLLARGCLVQRYFYVILVVCFGVVGTVTLCAVIYYKRWRLLYLYYIGRRRMHIGQHVVDYTPDADVFLTYDQDDLRWRRFMQRTFLPGLNQRDITYILGETDFPGGDLMAHVTGAVVGTKKTVILLSAEIFDDHHREYEMNLAIMREIDTRSLKIVPIFVEEVDWALYPREIEMFLQNQWERCLRYTDSDDFWDAFVDAVREDN